MIPNDVILVLSLIGNVLVIFLWLWQEFASREEEYDFLTNSPVPNQNGYNASQSEYSHCYSMPEYSLEFSAQMPTRLPPIHKKYEVFPEKISANLDEIDLAQSLDQIKHENGRGMSVIENALQETTEPVSELEKSFPKQDEVNKSHQEKLSLLAKSFPKSDMKDLERFLIARKGNVIQASEMFSRSCAWRSKHFPLSPTITRRIFSCHCMWVHGTAVDGTSVLMFRNASYDKSLASPDEFVKGAALLMDKAVKLSSTGKVTVLLHTAPCPGCVNAPADTTVVKKFISVMADNYPERLQRLILYPFPWVAHAVWSLVRVFIDPKTREKVRPLSGSREAICSELFSLVSPDIIPEHCWGTMTDPIPSLSDPVSSDSAPSPSPALSSSPAPSPSPALSSSPAPSPSLDPSSNNSLSVSPSISDSLSLSLTPLPSDTLLPDTPTDREREKERNIESERDIETVKKVMNREIRGNIQNNNLTQIAEESSERLKKKAVIERNTENNKLDDKEREAISLTNSDRMKEFVITSNMESTKSQTREACSKRNDITNS